MKKQNIYIVFVIGFFLSVNLLQAQQKEKALSYNDFLNCIVKYNVSLAAEKYNVNIAEAEVQASKIMPDPEFSFGWFDNQQARMKLGYGFEAGLSWDLELGGKRKARKDLAYNQKILAELELNDFFQSLRAEATLAFLENLQFKMLYDIQKSSYESMMQVVKSDSIRFKLGQISQVDAVKSKLEAKSMWNELQDVNDVWKNNLLDIRSLMSTTLNDTVYNPTGNLNAFDRLFVLDDLIVLAQNNRADFLVARQNKEVAKHQVSLSKAERSMDLGLNIGVENNAFASNIIAPTPGNTVVKAGFSIPLKFSNAKESGLKTARYQLSQADLNYAAIELELEKEIAQAYRNYLTKQNQIKRFEKDMLSDAKIVFEGVNYSYQRGASSLLEVLDAQRTYNEMQQAYAQTLFDYAASLVVLEKAVGIWDIEF